MRQYKSRRAKKEAMEAYLFLLHFLVGVSIFNVYAFIQNIIISFTNKKSLGQAKFVGLSNYVKLLADAKFYQAIQNTLLYVGVHLPILRIFENAYPDIFLKYQYSIPFSVVLFLGMALLCILVNSFFPYVCGKKNEKYKEAVYIGKFVLLFECFIIPVFGLIRRCGLWKHDIIHMIFVALVTGICSVLFLVIT